jgi:hypothetical protein
VRGASCLNDLKTVGGHICGSFKEACIHLGLLQDNTKWDACLTEVSCMKIGQQLHLLFATILIFCLPAAPEVLWTNHKTALCEDILYMNRDLYGEVNDAVEQEVLRQLKYYLQMNAKMLKEFPNIPVFLENSAFLDASDRLNQLLREEMSYDITLLLSTLHHNVLLLNEDQRAVYDAVLSSIDTTCDCFFVNGPGGTGKTFLYNTLLAIVRSRGDVALAVASSSILALLIDGGRTAYSRFRIPLKLDELSTCNISRRSREAHLINAAKLFIWDEAPMLYRFAFEAVDRTFRDITCTDKPFDGKVFVFRSDFRQVLPVILHSLCANIVSASLTRSFLWKHLRVMKLTINMRLSQAHHPQETIRQKKFAELLWILVMVIIPLFLVQKIVSTCLWTW